VGLDSLPAPYLTLEQVSANWTRTQSGSAEVRVQLAFNYPVNPSEVASLTTLQTDGQPVSFKPVGNTFPEKIQLATQGKEDLMNKVTDINIKEGLKVGNGKPSKQSLNTSAQIPARDPLQITNIYTDYEGEVGICYVHTNQSIGTQDIADFIGVDPATGIEVEKQDYGFIIRSAGFKPGSYSLTFSNQLRGVFGSALGTDYSQVIAFGEISPFVRFASEKGMYLSSKGAKDIGLQIGGMEKVKVTLYKIYENNVLPFTRQGGYLDDGGYDTEDGTFQPYSDNPYGDIIFQREVNVKDIRKAGGIY
jgi:hypothetical protein